MMGFDRFTARLVAALEAHLATGAAVALPEGSRPLWDAFCALSQARSYGAVGANPIAFAEIAAWSALMRWPLEPHHVETIRALDVAWLKSVHREARPQVSSAPLTPEMFDAVLG